MKKLKRLTSLMLALMMTVATMTFSDVSVYADGVHSGTSTPGSGNASSDDITMTGGGSGGFKLSLMKIDRTNPLKGYDDGYIARADDNPIIWAESQDGGACIFAWNYTGDRAMYGTNYVDNRGKLWTTGSKLIDESYLRNTLVIDEPAPGSAATYTAATVRDKLVDTFTYSPYISSKSSEEEYFKNHLGVVNDAATDKDKANNDLVFKALLRVLADRGGSAKAAEALSPTADWSRYDYVLIIEPVAGMRDAKNNDYFMVTPYSFGAAMSTIHSGSVPSYNGTAVWQDMRGRMGATSGVYFNVVGVFIGYNSEIESGMHDGSPTLARSMWYTGPKSADGDVRATASDNLWAFSTVKIGPLNPVKTAEPEIKVGIIDLGNKTSNYNSFAFSQFSRIRSSAATTQADRDSAAGRSDLYYLQNLSTDEALLNGIALKLGSSFGKNENGSDGNLAAIMLSQRMASAYAAGNMAYGGTNVPSSLVNALAGKPIYRGADYLTAEQFQKMFAYRAQKGASMGNLLSWSMTDYGDVTPLSSVYTTEVRELNTSHNVNEVYNKLIDDSRRTGLVYSSVYHVAYKDGSDVAVADGIYAWWNSLTASIGDSLRYSGTNEFKTIANPPSTLIAGNKPVYNVNAAAIDNYVKTTLPSHASLAGKFSETDVIAKKVGTSDILTAGSKEYPKYNTNIESIVATKSGASSNWQETRPAWAAHFTNANNAGGYQNSLMPLLGLFDNNEEMVAQAIRTVSAFTYAQQPLVYHTDKEAPLNSSPQHAGIPLSGEVGTSLLVFDEVKPVNVVVGIVKADGTILYGRLNSVYGLSDYTYTNVGVGEDHTFKYSGQTLTITKMLYDNARNSGKTDTEILAGMNDGSVGTLGTGVLTNNTTLSRAYISPATDDNYAGLDSDDNPTVYYLATGDIEGLVITVYQGTDKVVHDVTVEALPSDKIVTIPDPRVKEHNGVDTTYDFVSSNKTPDIILTPHSDVTEQIINDYVNKTPYVSGSVVNDPNKNVYIVYEEGGAPDAIGVTFLIEQKFLTQFQTTGKDNQGIPKLLDFPDAYFNSASSLSGEGHIHPCPGHGGHSSHTSPGGVYCSGSSPTYCPGNIEYIDYKTRPVTGATVNLKLKPYNSTKGSFYIQNTDPLWAYTVDFSYSKSGHNPLLGSWYFDYGVAGAAPAKADEKNGKVELSRAHIEDSAGTVDKPNIASWVVAGDVRGNNIGSTWLSDFSSSTVPATRALAGVWGMESSYAFILYSKSGSYGSYTGCADANDPASRISAGETISVSGLERDYVGDASSGLPSAFNMEVYRTGDKPVGASITPASEVVNKTTALAWYKANGTANFYPEVKMYYNEGNATKKQVYVVGDKLRKFTPTYQTIFQTTNYGQLEFKSSAISTDVRANALQGSMGSVPQPTQGNLAVVGVPQVAGYRATNSSAPVVLGGGDIRVGTSQYSTVKVTTYMIYVDQPATTWGNTLTKASIKTTHDAVVTSYVNGLKATLTDNLKLFVQGNEKGQLKTATPDVSIAVPTAEAGDYRIIFMGETGTLSDKVYTGTGYGADLPADVKAYLENTGILQALIDCTENGAGNEGWYNEDISLLRVVKYTTDVRYTVRSAEDKLGLNFGPTTPANKNNLFSTGYKAEIRLGTKNLGFTAASATAVSTSISFPTGTVGAAWEAGPDTSLDYGYDYNFIIPDATINDIKY